MKRFKRGDKVQVIQVNEIQQAYLHKTGTAVQPSGFRHEDDDVRVWFSKSDFKMFKEHQLKKID